MRFILEGRIKPYVRMTQRGKFFDPQAREYLASKAYLRQQMRQQMAQKNIECLPARRPLAIQIIIYEYRRFHNKDLDNQIKAILDAGQGIIYPDDRWIDKIRAVRLPAEKNEIHLWIERLDIDMENIP